MDWVVILGEDPEVHLKQHVEGTFFAAILGGPKRSWKEMYCMFKTTTKILYQDYIHKKTQFLK